MEKIKSKIKLKAIFTDSEQLYEYQKRTIKKIFKCPIYSVYGHTEGAVFAYSKKRSNLFYVNPVVGYLELLDENDQVINKAGKKGEIVVTGFVNKTFPLIRYRTQDLGIISRGKHNNIVLKKIEGRKQDYLLDIRGNSIPIGPALFDYNFDWSGIEKFQIHQKRKGEIIFWIVYSIEVDKQYKIKEKIIKKFFQILNFQFKIKVYKKNDIDFTKRGKFKYLIQHINS